MRQTLTRGAWAMVCIALSAAHLVAGETLSPQALAADKEGKTLYVACTTAKALAVVDVVSGKVVRTISLRDNPNDLAMGADGRLYVTTGGAGGKLLVIDPAAGRTLATITVGHTPMAPVLSPEGKTAYVCNRFNNDVSTIDLATGKEVSRVRVLREPVTAALSRDGGTLFVANLLPAVPADADYVSAAVTVIDPRKNAVIGQIALPSGSTALRGMTMAADGKTLFVTHTLGRYQLPTTQLERGWMNTNALSVIDVAGRKLVNTVLLDDVDLGSANPWGLAVGADGKALVVAQSGTHEISVIDLPGLMDRLAKVAKGEKVTSVSAAAADVPNDLSFLVGLRRRVKLPGNGPRGVAIAGSKAYAAMYFTDSLAAVDVIDPAGKPAEIVLGDRKPPTHTRRGEMLFHDADCCFQKWQSCASCHPDARVDGLNWDLLNDGIGNPKNTRSMLNAHKRTPVMSLGIRDNVGTAVRSGIRFIQFAVRPEQDAVDIEAYLTSLEPVASPHLVDGKLSEAGRRGMKIFGKVGCASCHRGELLTDLKTYDLGTGKGMDAGKKFITPTLVEVWRTGPYLYDGRAATVGEMFTRHNSADAHGKTSGLTK
ncbi:MAG: SMP-30/gluconolactonase/LRE family protein, partial [Planctomycetota bacterium]